MKNRGTALARAVVALVFTMALVVGVPMLLVAIVGNPFPDQMPTLNEVRILLTQNGQGFTDFILGTLAVLIWVIWAQLIVALVAEIVATVRHTEARRLRIFPGMQGLAARLVAAVTLATVLAAGPLVAPAVGALSFEEIVRSPATTEHAVQAFTASPTQLSISQAPISPAAISPAAVVQRAPRNVQVEPDVASPAAEQTALVVSDHTELWDLAESVYGDGVSWKLIAQANAGAVDADGTPITVSTEAVPPGTELVLPGIIAGDQANSFGQLTTNRLGDQSAASSAHDMAQARVETGDSMWTLAQDHVAEQLGRPGTEAEVADYWAEVVASNQDVQSGNVDMIYPGEMLDLPGEAPPDSQPVAEVQAEAAEQPEAPESEADTFVVADGPVELRSTALPDPALGHVSSVDDRSQAPVPTTPPAPDSGAGSRSVELGAAPTPQVAVPGQVDTSGTSSRAPAAGLVALGTAMLSAGVISAVRRRRDAQRRTRPAGTMAPATSSEAAAFEAAILHASHELKESTQGLGWRAIPASTVANLRADGPIEVHARANGEVVAVGVRTVDGERPVQSPLVTPGESNDTVEQMPSPTLLTPPMTASIIVGTDIVTGDAVLLDLVPSATVALDGSAEAVRRFVRGAVVDLAVSDRADDICVVAVAVAQELDELERVHVAATYDEALAYILRSGHGGTDMATPVVVLSATPPASTDHVGDIVATGATLIAPSLDAASVISINGDQATLEPSGTVALLAAFDDDDYRAVSELIDATSPTSIELVDTTVQLDDVLDVAPVEACAVQAGPVELKILGPVEVAGAAPFSSLKAIDVIAYLAFHRHGVDADQIKTWVWPPFEPPTDKAFANVMSRARTGLGADEAGEPFLSRAGADKTYRLDPAVTTDFDRVRALGEMAERSAGDVETLNLLKQALELIRGVPFTGGAASSFAWSDNHVRAQVEYTIDELVHRCADLALDMGDLVTARWAALKGLELVPGCEQCFRRRFLIAGAGNNRSELRRAMSDLEAAAMVDLGEPEAVDSISGDLLDLYNELDRALVAGTA